MPTPSPPTAVRVCGSRDVPPARVVAGVRRAAIVPRARGRGPACARAPLPRPCSLQRPERLSSRAGGQSPKRKNKLVSTIRSSPVPIMYSTASLAHPAFDRGAPARAHLRPGRTSTSRGRVGTPPQRGHEAAHLEAAPRMAPRHRRTSPFRPTRPHLPPIMPARAGAALPTRPCRHGPTLPPRPPTDHHEHRTRLLDQLIAPEIAPRSLRDIGRSAVSTGRCCWQEPWRLVDPAASSGHGCHAAAAGRS